MFCLHTIGKCAVTFLFEQLTARSLLLSLGLLELQWVQLELVLLRSPFLRCLDHRCALEGLRSRNVSVHALDSCNQRPRQNGTTRYAEAFPTILSSLAVIECGSATSAAVFG